MFKHPFSFEGRIGRKEYAITFLGCSLLYMLIMEYALTDEYVWIAGLLIPGFWVFFAQGTKRCHDVDQPARLMVSPVYWVLLLFQEGSDGPNKYGAANHHPSDTPVATDKDIASIDSKNAK
jgi:uncharacterized membrane protein YhaH (DUF805 family)